MQQEPSHASFTATRWSLVVAARNEQTTAARHALGELCEIYWQPVYCFLRRRGHDPEDAMDITQGFIARLLEKADIGNADRERGRFRNFLLGAVIHYEANERAKARAKKRGGGKIPISIDAQTAEQRVRFEPADTRTPEAAYLRQWALALLDDTLAALRAEYAASGKSRIFERLHPLIAGEKTGTKYADMADELDLTEAALKVTVHRMRKRYRELLRERVAATVVSPDDVDDELRGLIDALK